MEDDFSHYENMAHSGLSDEQVCKIAIEDGKDFFYLIRMLRFVFDLDIAKARDVAAKAGVKAR